MNILVNNLSFSYPDKQILKNIFLKIENGQTVLILGHNGAGKTTLVKCLLNKLEVPKETIFLDNIDVNVFENWTQIGYVPQDVEVSGFPITVFEFLLAFNKNHNKKEVLKILNDLNIEHLKNKNLTTLSGGERRRTFIARALLNDIKLLILDEPMVAIDEKSIENVKETLKKISKKNIPIIIITHNFNELKEITTHVVLMEEGIKFFGTTKEYEEISNTEI